MCCRSWKSSLPFALTFLVSIFAVNVLGQVTSSDKKQEKLTPEFNDLNDKRGFRERGARTSGENETQVRVSVFIDGRELKIRDPKVEDFSDEEPTPLNHSSKLKDLRILEPPKALYTDDARTNQIQGTVIIKVTFLASGKIDNLKILRGLGYGLSKQAVAATKLIKFEPAEKNGVPINVTAKINYTFSLY